MIQPNPTDLTRVELFSLVREVAAGGDKEEDPKSMMESSYLSLLEHGTVSFFGDLRKVGNLNLFVSINCTLFLM